MIALRYYALYHVANIFVWKCSLYDFIIFAIAVDESIYSVLPEAFRVFIIQSNHFRTTFHESNQPKCYIQASPGIIILVSHSLVSFGPAASVYVGYCNYVNKLTSHSPHYTFSVYCSVGIITEARVVNMRHMLSKLSSMCYCNFQTDHGFQKRRFCVQRSIKHNCSATIVIREICRYPEFRVFVTWFTRIYGWEHRNATHRLVYTQQHQQRLAAS